MPPNQERILTPAAIVKALRDGSAMRVSNLAQVLQERLPPEGSCAFGTGPRSGVMKRLIVRHVDELVKVGILSAGSNGELSVTNTWQDMQEAMRISLTSVDEMTQGNHLIVRPFLGPADSRNVPEVFVLMSFDPRLKPIYTDHICKVVEACGLKAGRADDFFTAHAIMRDIWTAIVRSRVLIADCTGRNPNVFYEIGVAHTVGRPVVLITQSEDDVPFDLRNIRFIKYVYTPPGMRDFEQALKATLGEIL